MLAAAMEALLGPLYQPSLIRFTRLKPAVSVGGYTTPEHIEFPVDLHSLPHAAAGKAPLDELASGAVYVLCYQPQHPHAEAFRQLAQAYVRTYAPEMLLELTSEAETAEEEGDWVGTVGRLWTVVQLEPGTPEALNRLAEACFTLGFASSARGDARLAARMARACAVATNLLLERFPGFSPGYLRWAEVLQAAGDRAGALRAVKEAIRRGLPADHLHEARDMLLQLTGAGAQEALS